MVNASLASTFPNINGFLGEDFNRSMQTILAVVEIDPSLFIIMEGDGHTQSIHQKDSIRIYLHNKLVKEIAFLKEDLIPNFEEDLSVEGCTWVKVKNLEKIFLNWIIIFFPILYVLMLILKKTPWRT